MFTVSSLATTTYLHYKLAIGRQKSTLPYYRNIKKHFNSANQDLRVIK